MPPPVAGDQTAEDHYDVEVQDESGREVGKARLPGSVAGMARFHELVAACLPDDAEPQQVLVCIETGRGPWLETLAWGLFGLIRWSRSGMC